MLLTTFPMTPRDKELLQLNGTRPRLWSLTCTDGVPQGGVVLGSQQGLVITWAALQLLLCTAGCHPDPGAVLVGHTFAHVPFHFERDPLVSMNTQICCGGGGDPSPVRFFSTWGLSCRSLDHLRDLLFSTAT